MQKINPYIKTFAMSFLAMTCMVSLIRTQATLASDHVDSPAISVAGPTYTDPNSAKPSVASGKPEDITDIYAFREQDQSGNAADAGRLCVVMTLNGLQAPGQARPFAPDVAYQIKVATDKNSLESTAKTFSFRFGVPDPNTGTQQIYLSDSSTPSTTAIGSTTAFKASPVVNSATYNNQSVKVFAGETDDPFYLDFRVLNEGLGAGVNGPGSTLPNRTPSDTFNASNVNAIVISLPMSAVQNGTGSTFYVWGRTLK